MRYLCKCIKCFFFLYFVLKNEKTARFWLICIYSLLFESWVWVYNNVNCILSKQQPSVCLPFYNIYIFDIGSERIFIILEIALDGEGSCIKGMPSRDKKVCSLFILKKIFFNNNIPQPHNHHNTKKSQRMNRFLQPKKSFQLPMIYNSKNFSQVFEI